MGCSEHKTCTVAGDGVVTCTCNTGWAGEKCNQCTVGFAGDNCEKCAWGLLEYPTCRLPKAGNVQDTPITDGVSFKMIYVPGGTFPTGTGDLPGSETTVSAGFWMGETEVTYKLWNTVYKWAIDPNRGYTFANKGTEGRSGTAGAEPTTDSQPVTTINWRDVMVWCNAASELVPGLGPVYKNKNTNVVVKNSTDDNNEECDNVIADPSANGFRLPESIEWECAARYQDGTNWTHGDHVSGDTTGPCFPSTGEQLSTIFGNYAWYRVNGSSSTHDVATKIANALGIYDMSGNVWEWCFDLSGSFRVQRGGGWGSDADYLQVGDVFLYDPSYKGGIMGFRLARTK
jgi:sulfatase modifying factor 1